MVEQAANVQPPQRASQAKAGASHFRIDCEPERLTRSRDPRIRGPQVESLPEWIDHIVEARTIAFPAAVVEYPLAVYVPARSEYGEDGYRLKLATGYARDGGIALAHLDGRDLKRSVRSAALRLCVV